MNIRLWATAIVLLSFTVAGRLTHAAVTNEEAAHLKSDLTPLGAEKAGNKEGSIPAWDGGYRQVWPGYRSGQPRPDPFSADKPVLQVTPDNAAQYADKLSDGMKALLQRFPDYRLNVYPTRRTAAAPQWLYENTLSNATRARMANNGASVEGAYGGIPFPIPKNGQEAMWNHLLAWKGESVSYAFNTYVTNGGKRALATGGRIDFQVPYYYRDGSLERFGQMAGMLKIITTAPPFKAGENTLVHDPIDQMNVGRKAWQYIVGQRRVRRAPNLAYDTPSPVTSGISFFDEGYLFNGALDRYDWKLLGKAEMFVPYNTNSFNSKPLDQVLGPNHVNPDYLRWELHRVWVVEATLAAGKRHALAKRRFYLDEDTWTALLADGWDAQGQLWHVNYLLPILVPELPAVTAVSYVVHDLVKGGYVASSLLNEEKKHYEIMPRWPEDQFSPAVLSGEGIR
jgi:hypothetical protein